MVNNSTNINKNYLSLQLVEWWSTIPPISNHLSPKLIEWWSTIPLNELKWEIIFVDIGGIVDHHSMSLGERWFDIGGIVDHHSMRWSQRWFWLILVELLTITQWVKVRGDSCWFRWNCWLSLNELKWEVICGDIGGILDHHSMSWIEGWFLLILAVELLTITQWVEVRGDFCRSLSDVNNSTNINQNHLSLQINEWWSTIPPISTKITSHLNSLTDGQQFHQYQQKSPLTITHWVIVNNSTNINNNHLSPQLIKWWSTIPPPISTKFTPLFNSLTDGQQFHQYQQKSPLTLTHWVMVNNFTNINKNHLSP